jgi:hypothetical protein
MVEAVGEIATVSAIAADDEHRTMVDALGAAPLS